LTIPEKENAKVKLEITPSKNKQKVCRKGRRARKRIPLKSHRKKKPKKPAFIESEYNFND